MGSMSYCLFENTEGELARCADKLEEAYAISELDFSSYELAAFHRLAEIARLYVQEYDRLLREEEEASVDF